MRAIQLRSAVMALSVIPLVASAAAAHIVPDRTKMVRKPAPTAIAADS